MATPRLSQLHKRSLRWVAAAHHCTNGVILRSHEELVTALGGSTGKIRRRLQTLETQGWIIIGRSPGGHAHDLRLTAAGHKKVTEL
jgi:hypothetical protein